MPPAGSGRAGCATCMARRPTRRSGCGSTRRPPACRLTAQQPYNNVVRTAVEALAAVLGGTNSLHTNALDETLALPSEQAAEIALRTQQVIMEETGVVNVADPLGGSWYVEALTDKIEAEAEAIFDRIRAMGELRQADATTEGLASTAENAVGPNRVADDRASCAASRTAGSCPRSPRPPSSTRCRWRRATRRSSASTATPPRSPTSSRSCGSATRSSASRSRPWPPARPPATRTPSVAAVAHMVEVARTEDNMVPAMLDAVRAEATLGEICDALRDEWGIYREPARF